MDNREDGEEHVYQTLDRREHLGVSERVRDLPVEAKVRRHREVCVSRIFFYCCRLHSTNHRTGRM